MKLTFGYATARCIRGLFKLDMIQRVSDRYKEHVERWEKIKSTDIFFSISYFLKLCLKNKSSFWSSLKYRCMAKLLNHFCVLCGLHLFQCPLHVW
jgi:hypothetical protein